jgi:hypothetical protein
MGFFEFDPVSKQLKNGTQRTIFNEVTIDCQPAVNTTCLSPGATMCVSSTASLVRLLTP